MSHSDQEFLSNLRKIHLDKMKVSSVEDWKRITQHAVPTCYCSYNGNCDKHNGIAKFFLKYSFKFIGLIEIYILKNIWNKGRSYHNLINWVWTR